MFSQIRMSKIRDMGDHLNEHVSVTRKRGTIKATMGISLAVEQV